MKILIVGLILCMLLIPQEHYAQNVFHIKAGDLNYFNIEHFLNGERFVYDTIPSKPIADSSLVPVIFPPSPELIFDGVYIRKEWWKRNIPDGTYYVYTILNSTDTLSYKKYQLRNGYPVGTVEEYNVNGWQEYVRGNLMSTGYYIDSIITSLKTYYYPKYHDDPVWSDHVYAEHWNYDLMHVHHDEDTIIRLQDFDAFGASYHDRVVLIRKDSIHLLYERIGSNYEEGYTVRYYHFSERWGHVLEKEIVVSDGVATERHWCESNRLYYHIKRTVLTRESGYRYLDAMEVILDDRTQKWKNELHPFYHCKELK